MIERRKTIVETIVETEWKVKPIGRGIGIRVAGK
jgi:hypothetical protein